MEMIYLWIVKVTNKQTGELVAIDYIFIVWDWEPQNKHENMPSVRAGTRRKRHTKKTNQLVQKTSKGPNLTQAVVIQVTVFVYIFFCYFRFASRH